MNQNVRVLWSLVKLGLLNVAFESLTEITVILWFDFLREFSSCFHELVIDPVLELASDTIWAVAIQLVLSAHLGFVIHW